MDVLLETFSECNINWTYNKQDKNPATLVIICKEDNKRIYFSFQGHRFVTWEEKGCFFLELQKELTNETLESKAGLLDIARALQSFSK